MFQLKPMVKGVMLACGSVASLAFVATPAVAQQQQQQASQLERVTITGSNIRRTDTETVAPVQIITREEIERTGLQTVSDVLRQIPSNAAGVFNEYANSFAPGTQSVSLRGLGQRATLVLINGRRMAGYGFAQNIQDSFVDLSSIPTAAVERIEVLMDGASAVYGSDAIAGVVNVILRRDFRGIEAAGNLGSFLGKSDYRANLTAGYGDLGSNKFNLFGTLDYYKRDGVMMSDTDLAPTRDLRNRVGGRNFQSLTAGGTWVQGNNRRANADCPNVLNFQQAIDLGLLANTTANQAVNLPGNTWCARDFSNVFSLLPKIDRIGFLGRATAALTPSIEGYAEVGFSRNESSYTFQEPFFAGTTGLRQVSPGSAELALFPYNVRFNPGVAGNPFSAIATYSGVLNDLGTRDTKVKADALRFLAGARYSLFGWDMDSAVGYSKSDVEQTGRVATLAGMSAALGVPSNFTAFPPVAGNFPLSTNSPYNLNRPSTNSQSLRDSIMASDVRTGTSELTMIDTKATREIGQLPGGPIGVAVGIEYKDEEMVIAPSQLARTGGILGQGATFVNGTRNSFSAYGELALPLTRTLEMQAALRSDRYSDFGSTLNPKVGLKFKPSAEFLIRANWGRGFRAPSLPEITPASAFFFTTITEPLTGQASSIGGSISANPNLQPETSRSSTLGVVFEPTPNFNASMDVYEIRWVNQVNFPDFQAIADNPNDPRAFRAPPGLPNAGQVLAINAAYINSGEVFTRGVDFDVRYNLRTTFGRFTSRLSATYIDTYQLDGLELAGSNLAGAYINAISIPRWRGFINLDWERGAWVVSARYNYTHSFTRVFFSRSALDNGAVPTESPRWDTIDLYGRYNVTPRFSVNGSIQNVLNREPPFDPGVSTTYFHDRTQYNALGRIFRIGVRYAIN